MNTRIAWGIGVSGGIVSLAVLGAVASRAWSQYRVEDDVRRYEAAELKDRAQAEEDRVGGDTPGETLELFAAALEKGDATSGRMLAVPALRDHVNGYFMEGAVDSEKIAALRAAARAAPPEAGTAVTVTEPVFVELIKYPSGAWKLAAF